MILLAVLAVFAGWIVHGIPANKESERKQLDLAMEETYEAVVANASPTDADAARDLAVVAFPILNPELADRERRKNPGFRKAEAEAGAAILNPGEMGVELMKDPEFRRRQKEAEQALVRALKQARKEAD